MISLVVAQAKNRVIGRSNTIPWRVRADLVRLKQLTAGQVVVLGRKSYESMDGYYARSGREMPGWLYLVVSRDESYRVARENARVVHSMTEALAEAAKLGGHDVFVIGGAQVFAEALPLADRIYLTQVDAEIEGDAYFPELDTQAWHETAREAHAADEKNEYPFEFVTLERVV